MKDRLLLAYARFWPSGLSPVAPGTCGSLAAAVLAPFIFMPLPLWGRLAVLAFVALSGTVAADRAARLLQKKDPKDVVIDEVLGQWITYAPFASLDVWGYAAGFALFRLFDITKPPPVRNLERLPGGVGIMADDAAAGVLAALCLGAALWAMGKPAFVL